MRSTDHGTQDHLPFSDANAQALANQWTQDRFIRETERTLRNYGGGDTDGGLKIVERYYQDTLKAVIGLQEAYKGTKRLELQTIINIDPAKVAVVALKETIDSVSSGDHRAQCLANIGRGIHYIVQEIGLEANPKASKEYHRSVSNRNSKKTKVATLRRYTRELKIPDWDYEFCCRVGVLLYDIVVDTSGFTEVSFHSDKGYLNYKPMLTEEAIGVSDKFVRYLMAKQPMFLPMASVPPDWTRSISVISGYKADLVRSFNKTIRARIKAAIDNDRMPKVLSAINRAQSVPYRINGPILDLVKWAYDQDLAVGSLPNKVDLKPSERPADWDLLSEPEQRQWKADAKAIHVRNIGFIGERLMYQRQMATADFIGDQKFYVPMNYDYRGRMYGMPVFNFQGPNYVRGLFLFDQGEPVGLYGLYWLSVHLANTGDFDKISKQPFDARVQWVLDNQGLIESTARNPKTDLRWLKADKPFLFVAACIEYLKASADPTGYVCHLPISFDGSCSGLQHLAAMTRDAEVAKLVNLTNSSGPQDIYGTVADHVRQEVEDDHESPFAPMFKAYGIGRSLVKRNVMTFCYNSKSSGMTLQHMADTMGPIQRKVLSGELKTNPFHWPRKTTGTPDNGFQASSYIAKKVYSGIKAVARKPSEAMDFLVSLSKALAHEGKFTTWTTPLGFPVSVIKWEYKDTPILLTTAKRAIRVSVRKDTPVVHKKDTANAIASCFVHSMDACHLQIVVNRCAHQHIHSIALVHDSFGCLPSQASMLRKILTDEFYELYRDNNVLLDIFGETEARLDDPSRLPDVPARGTLDIGDILDATYAFS